MKTNKLLFRFVILICILILSVTVIWVYQIRYNLLPNVQFFPEPGDYVANPTPGRTGGYEVCSYEYNFSPVKDQYGLGIIYVPVLTDDQCNDVEDGNLVQTNRDFNLIIIAHADGEGGPDQAHLQYDKLARHLASNAFIVVSINRYPFLTSAGAIDFFDQMLNGHLTYLYNDSPVRNVITNNIGLIGHSAGGRVIIRYGNLVEDFGKNLQTVILMAPTLSLTEANSFDGIANAFLGIQVVFDSDFRAFGVRTIDQPMQTSFKIFDEVGKIPDNDNAFTMHRDLLYVQNEASILAGSHYFQNQPFSLAYVNAFMQLHLNNHSIFQRFFKYQARPPSLDPSLTPNIWQQHDDLQRFTIADFEEGDIDLNVPEGSIDFSPLTFENQTVGEAHILDHYSPHHTQVLYFETNVLLSPNAEKNVTFNLPESIPVSSYGYLGFRMTQVYHPDNNPTGQSREFIIRLTGEDGSQSHNIAELAGVLPFPEIVSPPNFDVPPLSPPEFTINDAQTKNAMRSFLIRLNNFNEIDMNQLQSITFDFTDNIDQKIVFIIDDLALYRLGD